MRKHDQSLILDPDEFVSLYESYKSKLAKHEAKQQYLNLKEQLEKENKELEEKRNELEEKLKDLNLRKEKAEMILKEQNVSI